MKFRDATPEDGAAIRALVTETLGEFGIAIEANGVDSDLDDVPMSYLRGGGCFRVLVDENGTIVGCGGLYPVDAATVELRKMYFRPEARGRGLGRQLLADLIDEAKAKGSSRITLETASQLKAAIELYRSVGFLESQEPKHAARCDKTFVLSLSSTPAL